MHAKWKFYIRPQRRFFGGVANAVPTRWTHTISAGANEAIDQRLLIRWMTLLLDLLSGAHQQVQ